ncbi:recQ-mediated genome instability protein 1-like [Uranotaenia lowii]|uniref:recQ-mediated genome instability protein 1-like n=1 Tax=Uranotaenia lowii TaxID=190385 RepID=UPI0024798CA9|nr:recQ-mediated genome instability protein 1-like [Uranotaenia lowii]
MITSETNRATIVKGRLLRENGIKVLDEWLTGCVSFCLQENPKISNESLYKFTFEQWLLADLAEIGVSCLPESVDTEIKCFTLSGQYPLQLNFLLDISESCYDQLRNLYNKKLDEADDEIQMRKNANQHVKKKRMLKLELTDGKRTIVGMEHSPISVLNTKLPPGVKILVMGPIKCINRVLFLEPKNIRVLGGEVDTLLITNAFENILLKALNQPLNPTPRTEYEEVVVEQNRKNAYNNIAAVPMVFASPAKPTPNRHNGQSNDDWDDDMFLGINLDGIEQPNSKPPEQVPTISTLMDDDDDLEIINVPEEEIMNQQVSSTRTSQPSPPVRQTPRKRVNYRLPSFDGPDDDIDALSNLENEIRNEQMQAPFLEDEPEPPMSSPAVVQPTKRPRVFPEDPKSPPKKPSTSVTAIDDGQRPSTSKNFDKCSVSAFFDDSLDGDDDAFEEPVVQSQRDDICSPRYRFQIEGYSLVTVTQISQLSDAQRDEMTFVVFGEVEEVFERIRVTDEGWKLGVMVTDRSERVLPVRFHSSVISSMVGHEASEIQQMKRAKNPQVMKLLEEILVTFKNQLQELRCFIRVRYHKGNDFPFAMELYECTPPRLSILSDKIERENARHLLELMPTNG